MLLVQLQESLSSPVGLGVLLIPQSHLEVQPLELRQHPPRLRRLLVQPARTVLKRVLVKENIHGGEDAEDRIHSPLIDSGQCV